LQNAIGKNRIESITYEHALEHTFCLFESGVREADFVASRATFNLIVIIPNMPESVSGTEFVVSRLDIMIEFHIAYST
jgi:hypothetical protein